MYLFDDLCLNLTRGSEEVDKENPGLEQASITNSASEWLAERPEVWTRTLFL